MQFRNSIWLRTGFLGVLISLLFTLSSEAQNSPYSLYGLGDVHNNQEILNRAMGGVSEGYYDGQTINFVNPASYSALQLTTFDVGLEGGTQKISDNQNNIYHSAFGTLSYLELGVPLKRGGGWGLVFGLTPITKVNYDILQNDSLKGIAEPVSYLYQGHGGSYQAFVGTGFKVKGFRFGVNAGYLFGSVQRNTQAVYPQDSIGLYNSNITNRFSFGGFFWNAGLQVHIKLSKGSALELGASGGMKASLPTSQDYLAETFYYSGDPSNQSPQNLDTVSYQKGASGKITYPGHYGFGFLYHDDKHWMVGADYDVSQWGDYTYYGVKDSLQDTKTFRVGVQYLPSMNPFSKNYWSLVAYRIGFYTGNDFLNLDNGSMHTYAFSFGAGFPIRNFSRGTQYTTINTSFEIGKRGSSSAPLSENFFRFSVGFTLDDIWFIKRKYQ